MDMPDEKWIINFHMANNQTLTLSNVEYSEVKETVKFLGRDGTIMIGKSSIAITEDTIVINRRNIQYVTFGKQS
jgi:5-keto 4-deoxyuronate isomerase